MIQTCGVCGREIETGGFGGLPMIQHYKHKHPTAYYDDVEQRTLGDY